MGCLKRRLPAPPRSPPVVAHCQDGSSHEADFIICTLPFPSLRNVRINPPLSGTHARAVSELPYTRIIKVLLGLRRPFWQEDGLPVTLWSDLPIERIFPHRDPKGHIRGLICWLDGDGAEVFAALPAHRQEAFAPDQLARLRPSTRKAVEVLGVFDWGRDPLQGGAYHHFAPGQVGAFRQGMVEPVGGLRFAGEHTSETHPGMEAALESAERAVAEIRAEVRAEDAPLRLSPT